MGRSKMSYTIEELEQNIKDSKESLKRLEAQDETGWSDFDISVKGKKINMWLVKNHIHNYEKALKILNANSLNRWMGGTK